MSTVVLSLGQWADLWKKRQAGMQAAMDAGLLAGGMRCIPILQRATRNAPPASDNGSPGAFDTGNAHARFTASLIPKGVRVQNDAAYFGVIDGGRRKNSRTPPLDVIKRWSMRKMGLSEEEAKAAAWPIARAIGKRGLEARNIFGDSIREMGKVVAEEVSKAFVRLFGVGA